MSNMDIKHTSIAITKPEEIKETSDNEKQENKGKSYYSIDNLIEIGKKLFLNPQISSNGLDQIPSYLKVPTSDITAFIEDTKINFHAQMQKIRPQSFERPYKNVKRYGYQNKNNKKNYYGRKKSYNDGNNKFKGSYYNGNYHQNKKDIENSSNIAQGYESVKKNKNNWWYIDPQNITRGPFSSKAMKKWYYSFFLSSDTLVKNKYRSEFTSLRSLFSINKSAFLDKTPEKEDIEKHDEKCKAKIIDLQVNKDTKNKEDKVEDETSSISLNKLTKLKSKDVEITNASKTKNKNIEIKPKLNEKVTDLPTEQINVKENDKIEVDLKISPDEEKTFLGWEKTEVAVNVDLRNIQKDQMKEQEEILSRNRERMTINVKDENQVKDYLSIVKESEKIEKKIEDEDNLKESKKKDELQETKTEKNNQTQKSSPSKKETKPIRNKQKGNKMSKEFKKWCQINLKRYTGNEDMTLINFVMNINDSEEIKIYINQYYGEQFPKILEFADEFIKQKEFYATKDGNQIQKVKKKLRPKSKSKSVNKKSNTIINKA